MGVRFLLVSLASAAALGASSTASAQVVDLPDTSTVPVFPDLPDLPDLPVVPDVTAVRGVTGTESQPGPTQSGGSSGGSSGSSSRSGSASHARVRSGSNGTYTRFDRLPRRFERLLERILAGRDVDANLRRLERLLASAPPRLRARILRLVRLEIRALEQGRTTAEERRRIKRLHRIEDLFAPSAYATAAAAAAAATAVSAAVSLAGDDRAGDTSGSPSGVAAVSAAGISEPRKGAGLSASADSGILGLPSPADRITFGTFALLLGATLLASAVIAFALAAVPTRAVPVGVRKRIQLSRSDLATLGLGALAVTMLLLFVDVVF